MNFTCLPCLEGLHRGCMHLPCTCPCRKPSSRSAVFGCGVERVADRAPIPPGGTVGEFSRAVPTHHGTCGCDGTTGARPEKSPTNKLRGNPNDH